MGRMEIRASNFIRRSFGGGTIGPSEVGSRYRSRFTASEAFGSQRPVMEAAEMNERVAFIQRARKRVFEMFQRIA